MRALLASPLGFIIGISLGALGGGGSILAVPALVYGAGQGAKAATTTSLLIVGASSLFGMIAHWRAGRVRVGSGAIFGAVGIGGSLLGSYLNHSVDPDLLLLAFSGLMLVAAWRMWIGSRSRSGSPTPSGGRSAGAAVNTRPPTEIDAATIIKVVLAGSFVGFLTGFFGVGGGFVIVPALVLVLRFPMPEAVGTSLLVIGINSLFALSTRLATTGIEWRTALPFTLASMAGVLAGTKLSERVPAAKLVRWFVALLVAVAVYTAAKSIAAL